MKAVIYDAYGGPEVLRLTDLPRPEPKPGEILIRIHASSVTSGDARMRAFDIPAPFRFPARLVLGWPKPKSRILGFEFAGEVAAIGAAVTRFKVGDRVYGGQVGGAYVEYRTMDQAGPVAIIPDGLSFEDAAALPFGALTALPFLRAGKLGAGQSILIIGASGCVGVYAIQFAKHLGATVTAVCSGRNADLVRSLGADHVIDYTTEDYMQSGPYDAVMDTVGVLPFQQARPLIKRGGVFLNIVMNTADILAMLSPFKGGRRLIGGSYNTTQAMLLELNDLVSKGVVRPVIDRTYALTEIQAAHAYVDSKRKRGAVVIRL